MDKQKPDRASARGEHLLGFAQRVLDAVFAPAHDGFSRVVAGLWLAGLLVVGLYLWGIFYSWGNISFDFLDWAEVTGPRYAVLKDAMMKGQLPLHTANPTALRGVTDRYFSIPDTPFSPEIILLRFLNIGRYLFVDTVLFYFFGFIGLLLIYRKYHLSPVAFTLLFLLFNFNGDITGHLGVGHSIYTAYFLIPYLVYLLLELVERETVGWRWVLGFSVLELAILLQGLFHLYLWCLMALAIVALFNLRLLKPVILGGIFAVLVGLPRLLPPALVVGRITHENMGGFATVTDLVASLLVLRDPDRAVMLPSKIFPLSWWELDYFIGLLGFSLVVIFGILVPLWRDRSRRSTQVQMLFLSLVFTILSIGQVYAALIRFVHIPPFTGERVTARFFAVPLTIVLVLAVIFLQRVLNQHKLHNWVQLVVLGAVVLVYHDLNQHLQAWRIRYLDGLVYLFPKVPFNPAQHTIANHPDAIYTNLLIGGTAVAVLALIFLVVMAFCRHARPATQSGL